MENPILRDILMGDDDDMTEEVPTVRYRDRTNFENLTDTKFNEKFRLRKDEVDYVLEFIGQDIRHVPKMNHALSPRQQLLFCLHWIGTGSSYHVISDSHGVSTSTVSRAIGRVVDAILANMFDRVVSWPETPDGIPTEFQVKGGFPFVAGCADGTLIRIDAPKENELQFVDRNGDHSLNVMMLCGPGMEFYYVNPRWPGCVHDARVMRNSRVCHMLNDGWRPFPGAVILGDSGYELNPWMIIPLTNPQNETERKFNRAHKSTRRIIECAYGYLKEKCPCLNHRRLQPNHAAKIVMACATLHNISLRYWNHPDQNNLSTVPQGQGQVNADQDGQGRLQELLEFFE